MHAHALFLHPGVELFIMLLIYAHTHRSILGAAGYIILTPVNQLMVIWLKIWSLSHPDLNQGPFGHWPNGLTNCANQAHGGGARLSTCTMYLQMLYQHTPDSFNDNENYETSKHTHLVCGGLEEGLVLPSQDLGD
jgi:hypothetical protein